MRNVPAGASVSLTIPFKDANGDPVQPTGIVVTLVNEEGEVMHGPVVTSSEDTELVYTVPAEGNVLKPGETLGIRTLEVELATVRGEVQIRETYMLRAAMALKTLTNSFQTMEGALLTAAGMVRVESFNAASADAQRDALLEAFTRLTRYGYIVRPDGEENFRERILCGTERVVPREWPVMEEGRWLSFPDRFRKALRRAQVQEANTLLSGESATSFRRMGILSKTTGESSATFMAGKPLDLGIARETLEHLTGFIEIRMSLTRA